MKSIKVSIMGRQYPLVVKEDDEHVMHEIAGYVDQRLRLFKKDLASQNETTIMILSCLSIAEELFSLKNKLANQPDAYDKVNERMRILLDEIQQKQE
jgi:cell division protein ZapA